MSRYFLNKNVKFDLIYALILLTILFGVTLPYFSYPPRSDYWELFYSFHNLDKFPGSIKWLNVLNFDCQGHMSFRPIAQLLYYIQHLSFGANYVFYNILAFILYFLNAFVLYKFALYFIKSRWLAAIGVGYFTFLFSHFDILLWSFHVIILFAFLMFLLGFLSYLRFLKTGRKVYTFWVVLCFLMGMLCYESFFLWPFAIIIISFMRHFKTEESLSRKRITRELLFILGTIYISCFLIFIFTRSLGTYEKPVRTAVEFLQLSKFISSGFLVLFSVLFNNILVNLYPLLVFPVRITENIYFNGFCHTYVRTHHEIVFIVGGVIGILLIGGLFQLYRRRYFNELKIICCLLFLIFSEKYLVFFPMLTLANFTDVLLEFRFQYVPNAFLILIILFTLERFIKLSNKKKILISAIVAVSFILNIYCIYKLLGIYNYHLAPLKKMFSSIRSYMHNGLINEKNKLYIDKDFPDYLPTLCWNVWMDELFIGRGNYQWIFSKKEIIYFAESLEKATWVIDKERFVVMGKLLEKNLKEVAIKDATKDDAYIDSGKDSKYLEVAQFYMRKGEDEKVEQMLKKAIKVNPKSFKAYYAWGRWERDQGKLKEAEELFKKAIAINSHQENIYIDLGYLYRLQKEYTDAEVMFKKAIEVNLTSVSAYVGLSRCARDQGRLKEAKELLEKAIELNPKREGDYVTLGYLYYAQTQYQEAETMFKKALRLNPDNLSAYDGLAACYRKQGKDQEAERL